MQLTALILIYTLNACACQNVNTMLASEFLRLKHMFACLADLEMLMCYEIWRFHQKQNARARVVCNTAARKSDIVMIRILSTCHKTITCNNPFLSFVQ